MTRAAAPATLEDELLLLLCATAPVRRARAERIAELAGAVDFERLARVAEDQLLLALAAHRLEEACPGTAPPALTEPAAQEAQAGRFRATLHQSVTTSLVKLLEQAGIAAVALKGAFLAETAFGDPGLRLSADIDLLVHPRDLSAAVELLTANGYGQSTDLVWQDGLPLLHHALPPERPELPPVDLHWRIHWYETRFSAGLLERSEPDPIRGRRPAARDELAALLLFYARNSLHGLRPVADLAGWWDAHGAALGEWPLAPLLDAHPELRRALIGATLTAGSLVGLPARRILGEGALPDRRTERAMALANWDLHGSERDWQATSEAIDWLLAPPGHLRSFARRYWFQPAEAIARTYGRSPDRRLRNESARLSHGAARALKFGFRYSRFRVSPAARAKGGARRRPLSLRRPLARPRGARARP